MVKCKIYCSLSGADMEEAINELCQTYKDIKSIQFIKQGSLYSAIAIYDDGTGA